MKPHRIGPLERIRRLEIKVAALMGEKPPELIVKTSTKDILLIKRTVCDFFGVTMDAMNGFCRAALLTWPRHAAMYFCARYTLHSHNRIAQQFKRDHQITPYAVNKILNRCETEPDFRKQIAECEALVRKAMKK